MQSRSRLIHLNKSIFLLTCCLCCVFKTELTGGERDEKASTKAPVRDHPVFFAMLRMFPELNITSKKVLSGDLGVKPKNITR